MDRTDLHKFEQPLFLYGDVERALGHIFRVDPRRQRSVLRARLKHFQRLGLPGLAPGKGKPLRYSRELASMWLMALALAEIGLDPALIVKAIKSHWKNLAPWVRRAADYRAQTESPVFLLAKPWAMSGSWLESVSLELSMFERYGAANPRREDYALQEVNQEQDRGHWVCLLNFTRLAMQLNALLPVPLRS
jgi:hypothetical protein